MKRVHGQEPDVIILYVVDSINRNYYMMCFKGHPLLIKTQMENEKVKKEMKKGK